MNERMNKPWKSIYFWVKSQRSRLKKDRWHGSLQSCGCWLLLVNMVMWLHVTVDLKQHSLSTKANISMAKITSYCTKLSQRNGKNWNLNVKLLLVQFLQIVQSVAGQSWQLCFQFIQFLLISCCIGFCRFGCWCNLGGCLLCWLQNCNLRQNFINSCLDVLLWLKTKRNMHTINNS